MTQPLDPKLENRLYNFKFETAKDMIAGGRCPRPSAEAVALITELAEDYGNVGWIFGNKGEEITNRLKTIGVRFDD